MTKFQEHKCPKAALNTSFAAENVGIYYKNAFSLCSL